ncbi:TetR/AcrR family transcriptional regulator [Vibrio scophthalmi]
MKMSQRKAGRPPQKINARDKLVASARELFLVMAYDKVSIRLVAQKAGVDSALIRYYFGSKEGLFETMLRETLEPMKQQLIRLGRDSSQANFIDIMRTYYQQMRKVPQFPRLLAQVMHMPESGVQRKLMEKVMMEITQPMQSIIFDKLLANGVIKPEMDPNLCRISYLSLMVFPFIAPPSMLAIHGIELNDQFLEQLLEHNIKLMTSGFLVSNA